MPDPFVTEEYLRYQVERKVSRLMADYLAVVYTRDPHGMVVVEHRHPSEEKFTFELNGPEPDSRRWGKPAWVDVTFDGPLYDPAGGHFTTGACRQLPGGPEQTGEFTTVDNTQGTQEIEHEIEKSVTEESSSEVSFSENVELSNKTTIEAGTDTAKVSDELTEDVRFLGGRCGRQVVEHVGHDPRQDRWFRPVPRP